ncbi:MAG TPA: hypothetical protein VF461_14110 [Gemmatimonadaceae bacterium]
MLLLATFAGAVGCRETFNGFGVGGRARTDADQLFGSLSEGFTEVARSPKLVYARLEIAKHSLLPSAAFQDTAVWTGSSGAVRLLEVQGAFQSGRYTLSAHPGVVAPRNPADSRHVVTLSRISDSEYRWDTTVDFGVGAVRPNDVATVFSRLISSAEGKNADAVRAELASFAPRTSAALGMAFSLDSVVPMRLADGSTAMRLAIAMRSDLLKQRYPTFATFFRKYIDPARYHIIVTDRAGTPYFEASAADRLLTIRFRTMDGKLVSLAGPATPMPDSLLMLMDFKTKIKHFGVGFHELRTELVHVRKGEAENGWVFTSRREPEWDLPLWTSRLIRTPLRRPFAGEGSLFRIGFRGDGTDQTVLFREIRLFVQESAILRFLNSLSGAAFSEFADEVDAEQNAWLRAVFGAMREDARAAIAP